ncbi:MAG: malate:quinone oxidoreductase, partial [Helicobacter sp.]|nr:malate:quinone oxidoreductase [Helicobacter sp.]
MNSHDTDIVLIGGGIMSFTLATILKELDPSLGIAIYEKLEDVALESSMVWNNAGTGHQALCELNYTPENADGSIQTKKAFAINQLYEISKEFYAHCVRKGLLKAPETFINPLPHVSFVFDENVPFLRKRHEQLSASPLFKNMVYTEDHELIKQWAPLLIEGRATDQRVAATRIEEGTDVDFGEMVHQLRDSLSKMSGFEIFTNHRAIGLDKRSSGWDIRLKATKNGTIKTVRTKFVFLGAGGGAFPLLQKSGIPEGKGYSGFPVGGLWLICKNEEIVNKHYA